MNLEPNETLRSLAREYVAFAGHAPHTYMFEGHYVKVNATLHQDIARAYEALEVDNSSNVTVAEAYYQLAAELVEQWQYLKDAGYVVEGWAEDGQPYQDSAEMRADVRDNKHLYIFTGGEPHPFLDSHLVDGFTGNEVLRAVHDFFGHAAEGYGFGSRGEENAWIHHSQMFSKTAQRALTTETRGQNAWVNFGPQNFTTEGEYAPPPAADRPYADQKVDLLPVSFSTWSHLVSIDQQAVY